MYIYNIWKHQEMIKSISDLVKPTKSDCIHHFPINFESHAVLFAPNQSKNVNTF